MNKSVSVLRDKKDEMRKKSIFVCGGQKYTKAMAKRNA